MTEDDRINKFIPQMPAGVITDNSMWYECDFDAEPDEAGNHPHVVTPTANNVTGWYDFTTMADFILPRIIMLRDHSSSVPGVMFAKHNLEHTEEGYAAARAEWVAILNDIAFAMFYAAHYYEDMIEPEHTTLGTAQRTRYDRGIRLFSKYFLHLWD